MTAEKSAIEALKALLSQQVEAPVGLTNFTDHSVVKYVGGINIDWDPKDHPRDPHNGEFVKTPNGFLFGKTTAAKFPLGGKEQSLNLQPGDVAFKTPGGNVVVSHADDSYTLHQASGKETKIPGGSANVVVTGLAQQGKLEKIGENPAVQVDAKTQAEAEHKLANPGDYDPAKADLPNQPPAPPKEEAAKFPPTQDQKVADKQKAESEKKSTTTENVKDLNKTAADLKTNEDAAGPTSGEDVFDKGHFGPNQHPGPTFKNGKTQYTAKQLKEYQDEHVGAVLGKDKNGKEIKSGSWVDVEGKPVLLHASPYGGVTGYRWVSTKQQASNLPKENILSVNDFPDVEAIDDPTGKPYGKEVTHPNSINAQNIKASDLKHGSIMSKAVTGEIPNSAVKHKVFTEKHHGSILEVPHTEGVTTGAKDKTGTLLYSGDWVDIEGKPFQVHQSPNKGNIAMAKWVSTKQKKSNNTYDFPASVLSDAVKIDDPTGTDYAPVSHINAAVSTKVKEEPDSLPPKPLADVLGDFPVQKEETPWKAGPDPFLAGEAPLADWEKELLGGDAEKAAQKATDLPGSEELADWEKELLGYPPTEVEEDTTVTQVADAYKSSIQDSGDVQLVVDIASGKLGLSDNFQKAAQKALTDLHNEGMIGAAWMEKAGLQKNIIPDDDAGKAKKHHSLSDSDSWTVANDDTGEILLDYDKNADGTWTATHANGEKDIIPADEMEDEFNLPHSGANGDNGVSSWQPAILPTSFSEPPKQQLSDAHEWKVTNSDGELLGTYVEGDGDWKFIGNSGYTEHEIPTATVQEDFDDVHVTGKYDNVWTPVTNKTEEPSLAQPAFVPPEPDTSPNVFVHPVSGVTVQLEEGDEVYKAKLTENAFIVKKANTDTPYHYFNFAGKAYKPKAEQKSFDKNYEKVEDWPGKKAGTSAAVTESGKYATADEIGNAPEKSVLTVKSGSKYTLLGEDEWHFTNADGTIDTTVPTLTTDLLTGMIDGLDAKVTLETPSTETILAQMDSAQNGDQIKYSVPKSGNAYTIVKDKKSATGWSWGEGQSQTGDVPNALVKTIKNNDGVGGSLDIKFVPQTSQTDKSHANVPPDHSQSEVDVLNTKVDLASQVQNAVAGDAFTMTDIHGASWVYYKKADGTWDELSPEGAWMEADTDLVNSMALPDSVHGYTKEWKGAGYKPEDAQDFPGAPWGSKEVIGEVKTAEPKKTTAKKASADADSYTIGATEIPLKSGEFVAHFPTHGGGVYVHFTPKKNKYDNHAIYNSSGVKVSDYALQNKSAAQLKKYVKEENGAEIVAEKKALKKIKNDYSDYQSGVSLEADQNPYYAAASYINNLPNLIPLSYYGGIGYEVVPGYESNWNGLSSDDKMAVIASYKDISGTGYATMADLEKVINDKSDKLAVTRAKNAFDLLHRISVWAEELTNPETTWTEEEFQSELAEFLPKAQKPGVALGSWLKGYYPLTNIAEQLDKSFQQYQFKKSLTGLAFDPDSASLADLDTFAKDKGFNYLSAMPPETHKMWVLNALGDPTITASEKSQLVAAANKAKIKVGVAEVISNITKSNSPSASLKSSAPTVKGAAFKTALKNHYSWTSEAGAKITVTNTGHDEWKVEADNGVDITLSDAIVTAMINGALTNGATNLTESEDFAYGMQDVAAATEKFVKKFNPNATTLLDLDHVQLNAALNDPTVQGGGVVDHMTTSGKRRFLAMHLAGDEIGKYNALSAYVASTDTTMMNHMGSPNGPTGKAAYAAYGAWLQGQTWGASYKSGLGDFSGDENFQKYLNDTYDTNVYGVSAWLKYHPSSMLTFAPDLSVITTPDGKPVATKPPLVSDEAWSLTTDATSEADFAPLFNSDPVAFMDETDIDAALAKSGNVTKTGLIPPLMGAVPLHIKKLALWASQQKEDSDLQSSILMAIAAKAKSGEYLTDQTPVWISPDGSKFPISPGAKVYQYSDYYYVTGPKQPDGSVGPGYQFQKNASPQQTNSTSMKQIIDGSEYTEVFSMPDPVTWEKAKKENPDFTESVWNFVENAENDPKDVSTALGSGPVLTAYLKNHSKIQEWPNIYAQHKSLPEHVRNLVANSLHSLQNGSEGQRAILDVIEYKANKGHYASMQSKGLYDPLAPWLPNLSLGQTTPDAVLNKWSVDAKKAYVKTFGLVEDGQIPDHLNNLLHPPTVYVTKTLPAWSDLQLTATGKSLGGMHTKQHWVDQDGNEWMTKAFNSDPNAKARVDAEIAGIKIGMLFGFKVPDAEQLNLVPGQKSYAYLQHLKPGPGDFMSKGVNDLTTKQLQQAMEEHLLDWIISNHDSHSGNLRFDNNGNVFGIDKGQAFKHFPKDKLAVGYLPPENGAAVWYDQFYNALMTGKIDKTKADEVTKHVLRRAQQISKDKDEEFRAHLEYAFKNRDFWPEQYSTKQEFIDALVERKHNSFDDFVSFYKGLYKKSPYDFDIDTENLVPPKLDEHTHISVSEDYATDVLKSGLHGKAMMFNSADLEDSHILMSTAQAGGKTMLTGEAKIRKDGDTILSNWLKQHTIEGHVGHQEQSYADPEPEEEDGDPSYLPQNASWFSALVQGSKTVSSHNKAGDQGYNQGTLENMEQVKKQMDLALAQIKDWEIAHPGEPFAHSIPGVGHLGKTVAELQTMEQHEAWKSMLDVYQGYYAKVIAAKGTTEKISPHFQQVTYSPSKEALKGLEDAKKAAAEDAGKPSLPTSLMEFKNAPAGMKIQHDDPETGGVYTYEKIEGSFYWMNLSEGGETSPNTLFSASKSNPSQWSAVETAEVAAEDAPVETVEKDVKVGTKVLHVKYMPSSSPDGKVDFDTGELQLASGVVKGDNKFQTGHMYQIDFGNTIIEYRPWDNSANVALAQKGLLRFYKKDWKGDSDSIDEIFDILRQMGLSLDPADEESMETFYWNHQTQIMKNRKGGTSGKWANIHSALEKTFTDNPSMSSAETLQAYRDAWSEVIGEEKVKNADWMPKFSRIRPHALKDDEEKTFTSGRPYWHRADFNSEDLRKVISGLPGHGYSDHSHALMIAKSGAFLSTEERARFYGKVAQHGQSSTTDQSNGSSAVVYMRQNTNAHSYSAWFHPRVLMRSHNYAYDHDGWGKLSGQATQSPWEMEKFASFDGGEIMIKNTCSILDDVAVMTFPNESERQKAIQHYKDMGITEIHGLPITEVFMVHGQVTQSHLNKVMNHLFDQMKKEAEEKSD